MQDIQVTLDSFKKFTGNIFMIDNIPEISICGNAAGDCEFTVKSEIPVNLSEQTDWDVYLTSVFIGGYKMEQFAQPGSLFDNTYRWDGTGTDVANGPSQGANALGNINLGTDISGDRDTSSSDTGGAVDAATLVFDAANAALNGLNQAISTASNNVDDAEDDVYEKEVALSEASQLYSYYYAFRSAPYVKSGNLVATSLAARNTAQAAYTAAVVVLNQKKALLDVETAKLSNIQQIVTQARASLVLAEKAHAETVLTGLALEVLLAKKLATQSILYSGGTGVEAERLGGYVGIDALTGLQSGLATHNSQPIFTNESIQAFVITIKNGQNVKYMPRDSFIGAYPTNYKTWDVSGTHSYEWDNPDTTNFGGNNGIGHNGKGHPSDITGGIVLINNQKQRNDGFNASGVVDASGAVGQLTVQDYVPFIYDERENNPIYLTTLTAGGQISNLTVKITDQNGHSIWGPAHVSQMKNSNGIDANPPTSSRRIIIKLTYKPKIKNKVIEKLDLLNSNIEKLIELNSSYKLSNASPSSDPNSPYKLSNASPSSDPNSSYKLSNASPSSDPNSSYKLSNAIQHSDYTDRLFTG
jgi:hypothetical protein